MSVCAASFPRRAMNLENSPIAPPDPTELWQPRYVVAAESL